MTEKCQGQDEVKMMASNNKTIEIVKPLDMVVMGLVGPLSETTKGYKYILSFTDYYTKWVEFFPLKQKTSADVTHQIKNFIYRLGSPKEFVFNQDKEFVNNVNSALAETFGIERMVTPTYHPQANGLNARTIHTLKTRLAKLCYENHDDWDEHLEGVACSIRTQRHSSTKYTPFYLMFNRDPLPMGLPCENFEDHTIVLPTESDEEVYVKSRESQAKLVREKVIENVKKAREKQQKEYNTRKQVKDVVQEEAIMEPE